MGVGASVQYVLVTVQRNRYSVPCHLANQQVAIHLYPDRIEVSSENAIVACHTHLLDRDQVSYDWQTLHSIDREKAVCITQWRAVC